MAISAFKTWSAGEVLTASDLNSSFTQIINNATDLISPLTKNLAAGGFVITGLGAGANNGEAVRYEQLIASNLLATCEFRLSLATGDPVGTGSGSTTIYCVPYKGNRIALYDGTTWNLRSSAEFSLALGTLTSGLPYDVFCYDSGGTPTLEFTAWTNGTTRATALVRQNGVLSKTGALTRRYLGTFYTTSTTATEDSLTKRLLWNYYNRVRRPMTFVDPAGSWNYTTATIRQANGTAAYKFETITGVAEDAVRVDLHALASNTSAGVELRVGLGLNTTSAFTVESSTGGTVAVVTTPGANYMVTMRATFSRVLPVGYNYISWNEHSAATGTTTWYGLSLLNYSSGLQGEVWA